MFGRIGSRALVPAGAAVSVTTLSFLASASASAERTTAKTCFQFAANKSQRLCHSQSSLVTVAFRPYGYSTSFTAPHIGLRSTVGTAKQPKSLFSNKASLPPPSSSSRSVFSWYEQQLQTRPIATKMCTGGVLWSVGDAVAQLFPSVFTNEARPVYDWPRTARAAFFGFALHAPTSHVHFNFLEWMTIRIGAKGLGIPIFKAFMEQFVYWSWISNSLYHGAMGAMQGQNIDQIYHRIADNLWETQKAQWAFWIPVQLLNFQFVPVRHQLNVVLVVSIAWTALLSAWYPPENEAGKHGKM